jgi:hypothetical protein
MDCALTPAPEERRTDARFRGEVLHGARATVRPGYRVTLVDVSRGGVLVEAGRPLRPGANVQLQFERGSRRFVIAAHVLRCAVWALDAESGVLYRGALRFQQRCEWFWEAGTRGGYGGPGEDRLETRREGQALPAASRRVEAERKRGRG